jgi:drug/metabolite transporter (DMT)-like permease
MTLRPTLDLRIALALLALYLIWGSTYLAMRVAVDALPPFGQAGARFLVAGIVLLAISRARGETLPSLRTWAVSLPIGALLFGVGNGLVALAERTVPSGIAAVVCATTPLIAASLGAMRGERPSRAETLGMAIGVAGVVVLGLGSPLGSFGVEGLAIVIAPVGFAIGSLWARTEARGRSSVLAGTAAQMILGGFCLLAVAVARGEEVPTSVPLPALLAWVHLVVLGSLVGFTAYAWLLRNARPAVAMSYAYVNPIVAVLLGAVMLGEAITWSTVLAGALIVVGVLRSVASAAGAQTTTRSGGASGPTMGQHATRPPAQVPPPVSVGHVQGSGRVQSTGPESAVRASDRAASAPGTLRSWAS